MKMACAVCDTTIHGDIEYVDILLTHYFDCEGVRDSMDVLRELVSERSAMYVGNFDDLQSGYDLTDEQVEELREVATSLLDDESE
jgi:hypothetical protein